MTREIWKDIPGHEGKYQVSNMGRVKSLGRNVYQKNGYTRFIKERILKPAFGTSGYYFVQLGRYNPNDVHRLVLETFVSPCPDGMECRHLNGIKTDNKLENLRWGTRKENIQDAIRHGTFSIGEQHTNSKLTERNVLEIREKIKQGILHRVIAAQYGVSKGLISRIATRKAWRRLV